MFDETDLARYSSYTPENPSPAVEGDFFLAHDGGWTVTHIGHISAHLEQINCETDVECVILSNGGEQIVVSFRGGITLEYDHRHIFSPA
ncbi:MAG: hypothetical protein ABIW84_07070 [Ilumatobacteraceae bacterium]